MRLLRRGFLLECATVGWNVIEGLVAVTAGVVAGSVALVGFGIDSFIETASGLVVGLRLGDELRGLGAERAERVERWAERIAGGLLLALALYLTVEAGRRLLGFGERPHESAVGIVLTCVSLVVMPLLGRAKLRTAGALNSRALRVDAFETFACAWLSFATLSGLALNAWRGWWWADPLAGLALVPLIAREGWEAAGAAKEGSPEDGPR